MMKEYFRQHNPTQPFREKIPKDGPGPRGAPDCYYTSRSNRATFRYANFISKLRALEDEERKGAANRKKEQKDHQECDFFIRCDRKGLIKTVAHRVDLCLEAYEDDLQKKREKLISLLTLEEERDIRAFVVQAQAGIEQAWQAKQERLAFLLAKRQKEHEDKYKDTPLTKCCHVLPCLIKMRCKEAQQIQKFQMKENQAKRMAEIELENMWHELAMKETEALTARMEYDAIETKRREMECKTHSDQCREDARLKRERDREYLRQETMYFKQLWDADNKREEEAEARREAERKHTAKERVEAINAKIEWQKEQDAKQARANKAWDSLAAAGKQADEAERQLVKRREIEVNKQNRILIGQRDAAKCRDECIDKMILEEEAMLQRKKDQAYCEEKRKLKEVADACHTVVMQQIKDKEENVFGKAKIADELEYQSQLQTQINKLLDHKKQTDFEACKRYANDLKEQMAYNQLLRDRVHAEEMDQIRKAKQAAEEYEEDIKKMMHRRYYSDMQHPFLRKMDAGLEMKLKCPCSKPDYCK